jgi:hypothetical protein
MDNEEYLERLEVIAKKLRKLPDEMYKATMPEVSSGVRLELIERARTSLREYDDFLPQLSPRRREMADDECEGDVTSIRRYIETLEAMG